MNDYPNPNRSKGDTTIRRCELAPKPPRVLPYFNATWTTEEKLHRLRLLCPEKADACAALIDDALRQAWPGATSKR